MVDYNNVCDRCGKFISHLSKFTLSHFGWAVHRCDPRKPSEHGYSKASRWKDLISQSYVDVHMDYSSDTLEFGPEGNPQWTFCLSDVRRTLNKPYHVDQPEGGWKTQFSEQEKALLRPIAETLAMMDGNAFFEMTDKPEDRHNGSEWYEGYLNQASAIFNSNGGLHGWAGGASFAKPFRKFQRDPNQSSADMLMDSISRGVGLDPTKDEK